MGLSVQAFDAFLTFLHIFSVSPERGVSTVLGHGAYQKTQVS